MKKFLTAATLLVSAIVLSGCTGASTNGGINTEPPSHVRAVVVELPSGATLLCVVNTVHGGIDCDWDALRK